MTRLHSHWLAVAVMLLMLPTAAWAQSVDDERPPGEDGESRPSVSESAEGPQEPLEPARIRATLGGGATLRLINDIDFGQSRFAPAYVNVGGNYIFAGRGIVRHGVGLSLSLGLTGDGYEGSDLGVNPADQITLAPNYMLYVRLNDDFIIGVQAALDIVTGRSPTFTLGAELAPSFTYMITAGLGIYAQVLGNVWFGADNSFHPTISFQGGVVVDFEVLP